MCWSHDGLVRHLRRDLSDSRLLRVEIIINHLKGGLSKGEREALRAAIQRGTPEAELTVLQAATFVTALLAGADPQNAITQLDESLHRALQATGLSAAFDVSGRVLAAGPSRQDKADRRRIRRGTVGGRAFHVQGEVRYLPGTLPEDDREALRVALRGNLPDVSLSVRPEAHNVVVVTARLRANNALEAVTDLSRTLDDALADTGLFEVFDVTGRELRVAPLEHGGSDAGM